MSAEQMRGSGLCEAFRSGLTSPWGIALQLGMLALLVAFSQIDWERHLSGLRS